MQDIQNIQDKEKKKVNDFRDEIESLNKAIDKLTQENTEKDILITTIKEKSAELEIQISELIIKTENLEKINNDAKK